MYCVANFWVKNNLYVPLLSLCQTEDRLDNRTILYQMVALYDYAAEGPEDLEFSEGDSIDILSEGNGEWEIMKSCAF